MPLDPHKPLRLKGQRKSLLLLEGEALPDEDVDQYSQRLTAARMFTKDSVFALIDLFNWII